MATAASAALFAFVASPRTALFWYIFPLFGLGGSYLVQFRSELPPRWKVTLVKTAILSAVALTLDWRSPVTSCGTSCSSDTRGRQANATAHGWR